MDVDALEKQRQLERDRDKWPTQEDYAGRDDRSVGFFLFGTDAGPDNIGMASRLRNRLRGVRTAIYSYGSSASCTARI